MTDAAPPSSQPSLAIGLPMARNPILKVVLIAFLIIGLLVPLMLILDLVAERERRQQSVVSEIGALWGYSQRVGGPLIVVPARRTLVDDDGETRVLDETIVLLPEDYRIEAEVQPETRRRGLFEAVVYRLEARLSGRFTLGPDTVTEEADVTVNWAGATLALGLSDQRSIRRAPSVVWGSRELAMTPGLPDGTGRFAQGGMQATLPDLAPGSAPRSVDFAITLSLNGSDSVSFLPLGQSSEVTMLSDWAHPSFFGNFLPEDREISEDGFSASWQTSYFGRPYPQVWQAGADLNQRFAEVDRSAFGVRFFQPVDAYQQTERTVKYGILFIVFTFTALFLFEILAGVRVHIFQYGLVGLALALFYMLLLALAEQIGFSLAYLAGAAAVVGQIAFYTSGVLGSAKRTAGLSALLAALYAGLWVLMQLEDYALLVGALALFIGLTVVMAVTRRIDWYGLMPARDASRASPRPAAPEKPSG